jgi:hypothetical protein
MRQGCIQMGRVQRRPWELRRTPVKKDVECWVHVEQFVSQYVASIESYKPFILNCTSTYGQPVFKWLRMKPNNASSYIAKHNVFFTSVTSSDSHY